MKKSRWLIFTLIVVFAIASPLLFLQLLLAEDASGKPISDDTFIIGLETNLSTGYDWYASFNEKQLLLVDEWLVPKDSSWGRVGQGETHYFSFEKSSYSTARLTFAYKRAGESPVIDTRVFYVR